MGAATSSSSTAAGRAGDGAASAARSYRSSKSGSAVAAGLGALRTAAVGGASIDFTAAGRTGAVAAVAAAAPAGTGIDCPHLQRTVLPASAGFHTYFFPHAEQAKVE